jgi:RHS repeat-associated protein
MERCSIPNDGMRMQPANLASNKINAMGQRVQKSGAGTYAFAAATPSSFQYNARFLYDESGNLIGEYAPDGKLISETIWFNNMPIATLRPKGSNSGLPLGIAGTTATQANNVGNNTTANKVNVDIYYLHPDHLGTPRVMTRSFAIGGAITGSNAINKQVWHWYSDPFGTSGQTSTGGSANSAPNKNPQLVTGTAAQIAAASQEQNLRMPGQYEDQETKKFYNYFRTLDPSIGRYDSSDPIGLRAGVNTFGYVAQSPIGFRDRLGLQAMPAPGVPVIGVPSPWRPRPNPIAPDFPVLPDDPPPRTFPTLPLPDPLLMCIVSPGTCGLYICAAQASGGKCTLVAQTKIGLPAGRVRCAYRCPWYAGGLIVRIIDGDRCPDSVDWVPGDHGY